MTAPSAKLVLLAHAADAGTSGQEQSLLDTITHQPTWVVLVLCCTILLGWFAILNLFRLKPVTKLLSLLPVIIALALLSFRHKPIVATVLLSSGFVLSFVLVFIMLAPQKK